jgi:regulator of cell morphogenesis and NO signaling
LDLNQRKISDLVGENYLYASVLHYFGIQFYDYSEQTLHQVCQEKGICVEALINGLESAVQVDESEEIALVGYPIDLVIEYLKHAHYLFIKRRLPYITTLVSDLPENSGQYLSIVKDLKFVFPLFVEDFIHHIHEEEDSLFQYVMLLKNVTSSRYNPSQVYYEMEKYSIQQHAINHDVHDDEMKGIRNITDDYHVEEDAPLHIKVVYAELESFEKSLITHARIEDEILFPKALMLEKEVKSLLQQKVRSN